MTRNYLKMIIVWIAAIVSIYMVSKAFSLGLFGDDLIWLRWPVLCLLPVLLCIVLIFRKRINSWALSE